MAALPLVIRVNICNNLTISPSNTEENILSRVWFIGFRPGSVSARQFIKSKGV